MTNQPPSSSSDTPPLDTLPSSSTSQSNPSEDISRSLDGLASQDVVARGYWLPIGRANFFRHIYDKNLIRSELGISKLGYRLDDVVKGGQVPDGKGGYWDERLQSSVYRRLAEVLNVQGYQWIIPLVPKWRRANYPEDSDPDTVLLICENVAAAIDPIATRAATEMTARKRELETQLNDAHTEDRKREIEEDIRTVEKRKQDYADACTKLKDMLRLLVLAVRSDGFVLWVGVPKPGTVVNQEPTFVNLQHALKCYIYWIVGGTYFSHFAGSGRPGEEAPNKPYEQSPSLADYRSKHLGILNFFQINTILEGLYNSTFDPNVFFDDGRDDYRVEKARRRYSLGEFAWFISAEALVSTEPPKAPPDPSQTPDLVEESPGHYCYAYPITKEIDDLLNALHRTTAGRPTSLSETNNILDSAERVCKRSLDDFARRDLLRQFLRTTATESLQEMKWRIERCRRALLSEMLEITHRREPILQVEVPDPHDVIDNVSESQLRGYIMLLAAKLPLVSNVRRYLDDSYELLSRDSIVSTPTTASFSASPDSKPSGISPNSPRGQILSLYHTWRAYIVGISNNIKGLERAIEQARMDRMVSEEERIRAEQETIAEIQRLSENTSTSFPQDRAFALNLVANVAALISVALAMLAVYLNVFHGGGLAPFRELFTRFNQWTNVVIAFLAVIASFVLLLFFYWFLDFLFYSSARAISHWLQRLSGREIRKDERYYYEMDINMDAPIEGVKAQAMFGAWPETALETRKRWIAELATADSGWVSRWKEWRRARYEQRYTDGYKRKASQLNTKQQQLANQESGPERQLAKLKNERIALDRQQAMLDLKYGKVPRRYRWIPTPRKFVTLAGFRTPERHSYRAERADADEGLHKVYIGTVLRWRRWVGWWRVWGYDLMSVVLVYEILYHVPSSRNRYVFLDLRVVATYPRTLTATRILELKKLVAQAFINPWVTDDKYKLSLDEDSASNKRIDALLTLNMLSEEHGDQSESAP
jgi:hypothetical protein